MEGDPQYKFGDEPNLETKPIIFQVNQPSSFCWGVYPESDQNRSTPDIPRFGSGRTPRTFSDPVVVGHPRKVMEFWPLKNHTSSQGRVWYLIKLDKHRKYIEVTYIGKISVKQQLVDLCWFTWCFKMVGKLFLWVVYERNMADLHRSVNPLTFTTNQPLIK